MGNAPLRRETDGTGKVRRVSSHRALLMRVALDRRASMSPRSIGVRSPHLAEIRGQGVSEVQEMPCQVRDDDLSGANDYEFLLAEPPAATYL